MNVRAEKPSLTPVAAALLIKIRQHDDEFWTWPSSADLRGVPRLDDVAWKRLHRLVDVLLDTRLTQRERERGVVLGILEDSKYSGQLVYWLAQFRASLAAGVLELRYRPVSDQCRDLHAWIDSHADLRKAA